MLPPRCVALPRSRFAEPAFSALVFGMIATTHSIPGFGTISLSSTKLHIWESKFQQRGIEDLKPTKIKRRLQPEQYVGAE